MSDDFRSPGERQQAEQIEYELRESGRLGTRLDLQSTPFKVAADEISAAIVTGPRRYMLRRRRIEQGLDQLTSQAERTWRELAQRYATQPEHFALAWESWLRQVDVTWLNRLIDAHNRYFPIEANLPMDPRTSDYITGDGQDYRHPLIDRAWFLQRFPADLQPALTLA